MGFSEEQFETFLNSVPGAYLIYSAEEDRRIIFVSDNFLNVLGYTREWFRRRFRGNFRELIFQEDREAVMQSIDSQIAVNGCRYQAVHRVERSDGILIFVNDEGRLVEDDAGRTRFCVMFTDISGISGFSRLHLKQRMEFRRLIRMLPVGIMIFLTDGTRMRILAANKEAEKIFSIKERDMYDGREDIFSDNVHPDDLQNVIATMKMMSTPGDHKSPSFRYMDNEEGVWRWLCISARTVQEGDSLCIYSIVMDTTDEISAQRDLEMSKEERLDEYATALYTQLTSNPNSLCTVHLNLTRDICDDCYGASEFFVSRIQTLVPESLIANLSNLAEDRDEGNELRERFDPRRLLTIFREGRTGDSIIIRFCDNASNSVYVKVSAVVMENPASMDVESVVQIEDVNDTVINHKVMQKLTDAGYDHVSVIWLLDDRFSFRFVGKKLIEKYKIVYGDLHEKFDAKVIRRKAIESWVHPDERKRFARDMDTGFLSMQLKENEEITLTYKSRIKDVGDGWKQISVMWLDDSRRELLLMQADVTQAVNQQQQDLLERIDTEQQLRLEADKANESKSDFLSSVSHDMRTPLNAILGYDALALETDSERIRTGYLRKIQEAGKTLLSLINDTLDLQKIETGTVTLHPSPASFDEIFGGIITTARPMMLSKGIRFTYSCSISNVVSVSVDVTRVQEIFINLLSNAQKFTNKNGEVWMLVEYTQASLRSVGVRVTVHDTGVGISKEFLPKIYEPFTQERTKETIGIGGSGLGMSIVRRLVKLMDGTIKVASAPGKGTTIAVCMTFARLADKNAQREVQSIEEEVGLSGKSVLLCEDNEMNREIAQALLESRGMKTDLAVNGKEGVDKFLSSKPGTYDVILMDLRMPVIDGYEATRRIRASSRPDARTIPIIAMSADAYSSDVKKSLEAGMNSHISKPIIFDKLFSELGKYIQS